ncbi:MAG: type II toxin-antitoxin system HicA family toxin [Planctomycetota bacterium]
MGSKEIIKRLKREGWEHVRTRGSHHIFTHPDRPDALVVVPHPRRDLPIGTRRSIMKSAGWS